jgi:hypothetical protein
MYQVYSLLATLLTQSIVKQSALLLLAVNQLWKLKNISRLWSNNSHINNKKQANLNQVSLFFI